MTKRTGDDSLSLTIPDKAQVASGAIVGDEPTMAAEPPSDATDRAVVPGYRVGQLLGRGGMGEVVLAHDERIGRDVALKRMSGGSPSEAAVARFLREARIQARLEHPAIVPVHDLGRDADNQPYFTMKRLAGVTLGDLLDAPDPPSRQRLLRAFTDICSAIEFSHLHGVIHRDLKPANIVLGDFGEVYVLDWGVARAVGEREPGSVANQVDSLDGMTQAGAIIGTPGFMSPEQVLGSADVGPPTDIYALGAILFVILAGAPLHAPGAALQSTLSEVECSPAKRHPDRNVPPELDAVCIEALSKDPGARPTASELASRIEHYLDGDRDLERRRTLAAQWLAQAGEALGAEPLRRRAEAMQHAGRALALDPESREAAQLVTRLMLEPTPELPVELRAELASAETAVQRRQSRVATMSYIAIAIFLAMASWNGLHGGATWFVAALAAVMAAAAFLLSRRAARHGEMIVVALGNAVLASLLSRAFGPLIMAPAVTCVMAVSLTSYPQLIDRARLVIAVLVLSWIAPVAMEAAGVLDTTWRVVEGAVVSSSTMIQIGGPSTVALLVGANVITIVVVGMFANALARSRRDAQRQVEIQAWHLRQLLPTVE